MLIYNPNTNKAEEEEIRPLAENEVAWIRLTAPDSGVLKQLLEQTFQCHPLLVEDCLKLNQRPKLDRYKNNSFISFFHVGKDYVPAEMGIVIGPNYVITITKQPIALLEELYAEFQEITDWMNVSGKILYHILDRCTDEYVDVINHIEDRVDKLERLLFHNPYVRIAQDIFRLKRTLHDLRRIFVEEKTILQILGHQNFPYASRDADVYFIDIYDHLSRIVDSIDIFRESVTGLLELQMSMKSDRMNEIMKTLTIVSSIFLPLTFIVGLYGMNFHIPELDWSYGYLYVWIVIIVTSLAMWWYYKRKKWL